MNWLDMPLDEFVKLPYDQINAGCHIAEGKLMCWDIRPTAALYKAVDMTVPFVRGDEFARGVEMVLLLLIVCMVFGGTLLFDAPKGTPDVEKPLGELFREWGWKK